MFTDTLLKQTKNILDLAKNQRISIVSAESCTGGLLSGILTELPGSSEIFERGFVTYSNQAKIELLTVPSYFISEFGAVSKETAIAMAEGALLLSKAELSISVTGIAGPDGGTDTKPIGTVFIGSCKSGQDTIFEEHHFDGNRNDIRMQAIEKSLLLLQKQLEPITESKSYYGHLKDSVNIQSDLNE